MFRTLAAATLVTVATLAPGEQASAQDPFSILGGAAAGAVIGGAATGRAGGAVAGAIVGGATGAVISAEAERRRANYYWWNNGCYIRVEGGWQRVSRRYCG